MARKTPWWSGKGNAFDAAYFDFYGPELDGKSTVKEADFVEEELSLSAESSILDVPCGFGRHSIELALRGHRVTGVDINVLMIRKANRSARKVEGKEVKFVFPPRFIVGDMRRLRVANKFDVALCINNSLGFTNKEADDQQTINGLARALKPGGICVLEVKSQSSAIVSAGGFWWPTYARKMKSGLRGIQEIGWNPSNSRWSMHLTWVIPHRTGKGHRVVEHHISIRLYTQAELTAMAKKAGLQLKTVFGGYDGSEYSVHSRILILIFKKPG